MPRPILSSPYVRRLLRAAPLAGGLALVAAVVPAGQASAATGGCTTSGSQVTCTFTETGGAQAWTVPVGVTSAAFTLYGAEGGASSTGEPGGLGAEVTATLRVSPGTVFQVNVGQGGGTNDGASPFNGGGPGGPNPGGFDTPAGGGGDGGGATDVRSPASNGSYPVTSDVLAAGGGGGGGLNSENASGGAGGQADSPGANGGSGAGASTGGGGGGAGTAAGPGAGGARGTIFGTSPGSPGAAGGTGASQGTGGGGAPGGGGGGGGFNGGGGGGEDGINFITESPLGGNGGGGGGASYTGGVAGATITEGVASPGTPNGDVIITYTQPSLSGANLNGADLTGMYLGGANLSGANLNKANLTGADLAGANLTDANLNKANLTGADLAGATVTGANFNDVKWSDTTCPDGTNSNSDGGTCAGHL